MMLRSLTHAEGVMNRFTEKSRFSSVIACYVNAKRVKLQVTPTARSFMVDRLGERLIGGGSNCDSQ